MAEFKCISCGAIKESDKVCSCPVCGYKMIETPYDRKEAILKEIKDFLSHLRLSEISYRNFNIYRKEIKNDNNKSSDNNEEYITILKRQDDDRFPSFSKIQGYVSSSTKTEIFYERLINSITHIKEHIHESYNQKYHVSFKAINSRIDEFDNVLLPALKIVGIETELPEAILQEINLDYSEIPDDGFLSIADEILNNGLLLSDKIRKFIKQNNIYGTAYQKKHLMTLKVTDNTDYASELKNFSVQISKVLAKKYNVDIFSDGSDELQEMLMVLWNALEAIMTFPVVKRIYTYTFCDGFIAIDDEIKKELLSRINRRYEQIDSEILAFDFLSDKNEDELFEIYDSMIELDAFGFTGVNRNNLLKIGESEKKLNELIGLSGIKESIKKIKAYALANKEVEDLNIHMCFMGNPGSGKTEVARYIAGILYENKILPTKKVIEVDRSGLVSEYFGATAEKTSCVIDRAMGGVLFIDEAYALGNNNDAGSITDYGKEAIDTLVKAMEDNRGKFCVILAGYKNEMLQMLSTNPGFKSRIQFMLDFPNYSRDELKLITELILRNRHYTIGDAAMSRVLDITDVKRKEPNFANAREIRNILDQVIMCQNLRTVGTDDKELGVADVNKYIKDAKIKLPVAAENISSKVLTGEEELEQLIGLDNVKRMIKKIKAYAKRNKNDEDFNLHMCFYGNPGTGKTEVARILSRILYDAGVLGEAKLVETDGHGLLGKYVGETAPKTQAKINEAMNGVLFIDEAYGLVGSTSASGSVTSYGEEAIAVLLKEMEDKRGQFCTILAGYKNEMKNLLSANPGFESRIQFTLDFPDYTREELGEIAKAFLTKKKYDIEEPALERLLDATEYFRNQPNFANARTVRNILDQVLMNQNLRTEDFEDDRTIVIDDVEDYLADEGIDLSKPAKSKGHIGFLY